VDDLRIDRLKYFVELGNQRHPQTITEYRLFEELESDSDKFDPHLGRNLFVIAAIKLGQFD